QLLESPDLLGVYRRLAHGNAEVSRHAEDQPACNAGQDVVRAWIGAQLTIDHAEHVRRAPLRYGAIPDQQRLPSASLDRPLLRDHVREQVDRLDVAPCPA